MQSLAVDAAGFLYVIYDGTPDVRKIDPTSGEELEEPRFEVTTSEGPAIPTAVAVDAVGHVWVFGPTSFSGGQKLDPIHEFDADGKEIDKFGKGEFGASTGLATNLCPGNEAPGNLYVSNTVSGSGAFVRAYGTAPTNCGKAITGEAAPIQETGATLNGKANPKGQAVTECFFEYGTSETYGQTASCAESSGGIGTGTDPVPVHAVVGGLTAGTVYHFRLVVGTASGTESGSDATFKTLGPPAISEDHTASATDTEASVRALVNPEGLTTSYHFEYGLDATYGKSTQEIGIGSDRSEHPALATLRGLLPGTTYHWRIVAANSSDTTEGEDHTLTTYRTFVAETGCPNEEFRTAASALLPDCRAYEMVSPVDKNGSDIAAGLANLGDPGGQIQSTPEGDKITYTSRTSFGDQPNFSGVNQYLAGREDGEGWSSHGIHPAPVPNTLFGLAREFMAFSPDLCSAWLGDGSTPPLKEDGQKGLPNIYRRDNCGEPPGALETLTAIPPELPLPPGTPPNYLDNKSVQGVSDDSRHAVFAAVAALTPEAPTSANAQVYDHFGGANHLVSILPGGLASASANAVGSGGCNLDHAVSTDGSRVYWTANFVANTCTGEIYLRQHPEQGKVGEECSEPAKACTIAVSTGSSAFFWTASADGSKALYSEGEKLFEFEEESQSSHLVAEKVKGVAGASDDLSRIYFVSSKALTGAQQNSEGDEAKTGEPNLYLDEAGTKTFVARLVEGDVGKTEPDSNVLAYSIVEQESYQRPTRVTPDGAHLAFESQARLTGFDNRDIESGKASVEVFSYEVGGELRCVSCIPSGARPSAARLLTPYHLPWLVELEPPNVQAAAWIPTWEHPLRASNVLSDDGGRLFFNSNDKLLPRDTNGTMDVYEWEAPGEGKCTSKSPSFQASSGGCLYLISSGESPFESEFWEATPDGDDVFFTTASSLLPQDPGLIDLYDARVDGGFPQPIVKAPCEGEACQSPPPPPNDPTPASAAYSGPGNEKKAKLRCAKGKRLVFRAGNPRCLVKKHKGAGKKQRANRNRRAAR
ncbi:MAG TPA: hypothetical protein VK471_02410 [Solirubrobacterales bacterium]|nr:hypothetical protein [Solirubrobacterales bacterium]